jgi:hypothetical protein
MAFLATIEALNGILLGLCLWVVCIVRLVTRWCLIGITLGVARPLGFLILIL